jgi:cytochrome c553
MNRRSTLILMLALAPAVAAAPASRGAESAAPADRAGIEFFEKKVRPVLSQNCYKCHSASSQNLKGNLRLDSREALLSGGDSGPAVVPGDTQHSLLISAIRHATDELQMPPKAKLDDSAIADLTQWVKMGVPWPQEEAAPVAKARTDRKVDYDQLRRDHWAWQPIKPVTVPQPADAAWAKSDVDRFVLARLEASGLKPAAPAEKTALIRRVTFDLVGLPPTVQEIDAFLNDRSPDALSTVVDRLLASPQFGEKWGRHWLDVARYAESTGMSRNFPYPQAWRYRDYVIDSFNADRPYDRFITEQVAGDLLPYASPEQHNRQLIATGLLAVGPKDLNERDRAKFVMDNVDEQIDVVGRAVLGTTISCARCHDHKFDPIPTEEYYSLAGIFRSTAILTGFQNKLGGANAFDPKLVVALDGAAGRPPEEAVREHERNVRMLKQRIERVRAEVVALGATPGRPNRFLEKVKANIAPARDEQADNRKFVVRQRQRQLAQLEAELRGMEAAGPGGGPTAVGVRDVNRPADCRVHDRGETDKLGPEVPRGFISLVRLPEAPKVNPSQSGRLELAQWLTSKNNPLTARVMANRVWAHLFGQGLVRTVDNFGTTGEKPSHPELLDYLAAQFTREGWSVKKLVRSLVLSRTYQLSATYDAANAEADPSDRLLWRMAPRRLEAEALRDAMLAVGGNLGLARPVGSPVMNLPYVEVRNVNNNPAKDRPNRPRPPGVVSTDTNCRSVYLPVMRGLVPPALDVFDFAEPSLSTGSRDVTTVATQALYLMNNPFVMEQSRRLADRLLAENGLDDAARVGLAYRTTLARTPTDVERKQAAEYLAAYSKGVSDAQPGKNKRNAGADGRAEAWASLCQVLLASAEFRYVN